MVSGAVCNLRVDEMKLLNETEPFSDFEIITVAAKWVSFVTEEGMRRRSQRN